MKLIHATDFKGERPWAALDLLRIQDATVRLHWTDQPYQWHVNDGPEAFIVLDGVVSMHYRQDDQEHIAQLTPGVIFIAEEGDEHVARPCGAARILVVEQAGSI